MILCLAGGVGGAKLADGLARILPPDDLTIVVNTGDDFEHLGLAVSPDLDTVMYTLAGIANPETGWGLAGESWAFMDQVARLGGETWFRLGDRDLATHVTRTRRLRGGDSLSAITNDIAATLGVRHRLFPMSDNPVRTRLETDDGVLDFQDWFVRRRAEPSIRRVILEGIDRARPSPGFAAALTDPRLAAIIIAPSNPFVSVGPILALPGVAAEWRALRVPVVAVSPIVGGAALKGPAARNLADLGFAVSPAGVAQFYGERIDGLIIDQIDAALAPAIATPRLAVRAAPSIMRDGADREALARVALDFATSLRR